MPTYTNSVESSNIKKVIYNDDILVLSVEFTNNKIYDYYDVPSDIYLNFIGAKSKGTFFAQKIKGVYNFGEYKDARLDAGEPVPEIDENTGLIIGGFVPEDAA